ncbi:MAG: phosphotransferase [Ilumatobacteraceae bacterium]
MTDAERPLAGGNATAAVIRVGDTVRKPSSPTTPLVHRYLRMLRAAGVDVPEVFGDDEHDRQVIEFVPGTLAMELLPLDHSALRRVGAMIRRLHDASTGFPVPPDWSTLLPTVDPDLICHNDLAPWNLVMGERWVFIDWDGAGPSTRLWDLAYAAQSFALLVAGQPVAAAAARLAALADGYDADAGLRAALPETMLERTAAMHDMLRSAHAAGRQPWGRMYVEGHGEHWRTATEYVRRHRDAWQAALDGR